MEEKPPYEELENKIAALTDKIREQSILENRYRNLVDSTSDSLYLVDARCCYLFMNDNHARRLNLPREELIGRCYAEFHSEKQSEEFSAKVKNVMATGKTSRDEHQSSRDNSYFLRTFNPVKESVSSGKIIAVSIISQDITERHKVEEALLSSEEKYRLLIEHSSEAIFIISQGRIRFANKRTNQILGYEIDELTLMSLINLVISEDQEMVFERQKAIIEGDHSAATYSFRIVSKSGATHWVETNTVAVHWEEKPATLNFMRDITRQKITENRLLQAQKMESIGTLAGGIAHDFNNLLMGIQGHASLALLSMDSKNRNYEHIKTIENLVMSGADLTKQLLGFARGGKYEVKTVDLNELIIKTSDTIGRTKKEIRIHRTLENNISPVDVDQGQIEQVLLNLLVNAWQAMPGGGDLYLETRNVIIEDNRFKNYLVKDGHYVKISVTDTGVGMDEKTKERIFEPFFTTKEMGRGTGLGLASVYGIIKNHNGFINVYSEKGQGTTFNIYIPVSIRKTDHHSIETTNGELTNFSETILIVDDEMIILDVAKDMLKMLGFTVHVARDGLSAIDLYKLHHEIIDLVILDMVMPEMGGGEVFDELKLVNPDVKVLLSSGYSLNGQASRIISRGCTGFIQKPFTIHDLSSQLRKILPSGKRKISRI